MPRDDQRRDLRATGQSPHRRHRSLVEAIEKECRVSEWRTGDVDLWPVVSQDLFLELLQQAGANTAPRAPRFAARAAMGLATPALNRWKSRHDPPHRLSRPRRADAVLLGDGVSLDRVDGAWRDRFGEPIAAALERQNRTCFVMESGDLTRLPWVRPTFAANRVAARAAVGAVLAKRAQLNLPDHQRVLSLLSEAGVNASCFDPERLERRARSVAAQAAAFTRILCLVRPKLAFVVTYYAGLGHAFALACRRMGILCVDLQHCPHDEWHRAYRWSKLPPQGFSTLPGLFWTWNEADANNIRRWSDCLDRPWHRAIAGGHTQVAALGEGTGERLWHEALTSSDGMRWDREILVALQPIGGRIHVWEALAELIENAPPNWRWWIRRHPASTPEQDRQYSRLVSLRRSNVVVGPQSQLPLPALIGHMDALVSLASGAAGEAAMFGVPAFFLDDEANDTFPGLIDRGQAAIVGVGSLVDAISRLPRRGPRPPMRMMPIERTLSEIDGLADDYSRMCEDAAGLSHR